ncbi:hypothetical protein V1514DRAFT_71130 [Lipomyces japonicus]|uniref:uncharacterized protein n=1 Tax=Lipomyces japonicus TaxID=56871 RepID=UPI0034CD23CA
MIQNPLLAKTYKAAKNIYPILFVCQERLKVNCSDTEFVAWYGLVRADLEEWFDEPEYFFRKLAVFPKEVKEFSPEVAETRYRKKVGHLIRRTLSEELHLLVLEHVSDDLDSTNVIDSIQQLTGKVYNNSKKKYNFQFPGSTLSFKPSKMTILEFLTSMDLFFEKLLKEKVELSQDLRFRLTYARISPSTREYHAIVDNLIAQSPPPENIYSTFEDIIQARESSRYPDENAPVPHTSGEVYENNKTSSGCV